MKILVLNCGSSSLKYQLIDMENEKVIAKGYFDIRFLLRQDPCKAGLMQQAEQGICKQTLCS